MKNIEKIIFTAIFIAGLGAYATLSIMNTYKPLKTFYNELEIQNVEDVKEAVTKLEDTMIENVSNRYSLIEAYGFVSKILCKNEVNGFDYVRDKNGFLSLGNFWNEVYDIDEKALTVETAQFNEYLKKKGIDMLFVSYPQKVSEKWTDGYAGIPYDDFSFEMKQFMIQIRKYRIPNVDLAKVLEESELPYEDLFFKTDHHWTSQGAFIGFTSILDKLEEMGYDLDSADYYKNLDNYKVIHYDNMMLGSSGRSVGLSYAGGKEDFDLYYLDNGQKYEYTLGGHETMHGTMSDTIINFHIPEELNEDPSLIYTLSMYDMYMRGIRDKMEIKAENVSDKPKILMITDSYASPIGTWLAPMCSQVDFLWAKYNSVEDIKHMIEKNDYDLVIFGLYPNDMNADFIHFATDNDK